MMYVHEGFVALTCLGALRRGMHCCFKRPRCRPDPKAGISAGAPARGRNAISLPYRFDLFSRPYAQVRITILSLGKPGSGTFELLALPPSLDPWEHASAITGIILILVAWLAQPKASSPDPISNRKSAGAATPLDWAHRRQRPNNIAP